MDKVKQKTYLNIFIFFSIIAGLFYVSDSYLIKTVKSSSAEIVNKKQEIEKLNTQSNQIVEIRSGYEYMQKEMDKVSDLAVNYSDIIKFIVEVENIAEKNSVGLDINVSDKEGGSVDNNLSYVGYSVKASGNFDNLMRFLVYLENLKYASDIESFKMFYDDENKKDADYFSKINPDKIVLNVSLKVYVKNRNIK